MIAVFSGLYYVLSYLPGIRAVGVTSVTINIEAFMASIFGIVLGPFLGAITAFAGAMMAWGLPPGSPTASSAVFIPAPVINAFIVGLIFTKRWRVAFISLLATIVVFWFLPPALPWDQYSHVGFWVMWDKILALILIIPVVFLISKTRKRIEKVPERADVMKKRTLNYITIFPVIASLLIIINTMLIILEGNVLKYQISIFNTVLNFQFGIEDILLATTSFSYLWLVIGIGILVCAALLHLKPEKLMLWNILIFLFSCSSVIVGGGFIVGLFLGVFSGIIGTLKRRFTISRIASVQILLFFLLAFIGNEADNALGADIFAVPLVYNGIFGFSTDVVRGFFLIAPFFYPAIRIVQAIITTLIAVPLMRNLNAAGLGLAKESRNE
ncbi:MAG: hypothetical protein JSV05_09555 [Candidatus Bathyarchaeota archaeon]|nr:MAG: hypothetical protein JSV05_09555 [Candidatus Bathyarchaeota archaeon]